MTMTARYLTILMVEGLILATLISFTWFLSDIYRYHEICYVYDFTTPYELLLAAFLVFYQIRKIWLMLELLPRYQALQEAKKIAKEFEQYCEQKP